MNVLRWFQVRFPCLAYGHYWLVGRHPVTLELKNRVCQLCGKEQKASVKWRRGPDA